MPNGLKVRGDNGDMTPAKKPTRWITSAEMLVRRLRKRCDGSHHRQELRGKGRPAQAAIYPRKMRMEILMGIR